ncbi:hypothetical protein pb186bvf_004691 [Paramecium bursaria]
MDDTSEKDMIGSLLEEDESEPSEFRSSITRSQKGQPSPVKAFEESPQQMEFPMLDSQSYYIAGFQSQPQLIRPHSMSQEYSQIMMQNIYYQPQDVYFSQKRTRKHHQEAELSIVLQCQDQYASLNVQQQFMMGNQQQREKIFKALEEDFYNLSKHKFGNYVIQKIIECGNPNMCMTIYNSLNYNMMGMCMDKFGCRVVQKLIEFIYDKPPYRTQFLYFLQPNLIKLIFDQCGNHVIQKVIDVIPPENSEFIIEVVEKNVEKVVTHSYGCRIAQKCLETYPNEKLQSLYFTLSPLIEGLSFCAYGNYIVQHMINQAPIQALEKIKNFIRCNMLKIGQDKYASNVAQKFITKAEDNDINEIANQVLSDFIGTIPILFILINDQFGNYVIQHLYNRCKDNMKTKIQTTVKKLDEQQFTQYGNQLQPYQQADTSYNICQELLFDLYKCQCLSNKMQKQNCTYINIFANFFS